ncbi:hypothetical protein Vadar_019279 [Vaccinium darrowii]|uniref:Uncharacterized protein n=1 Tax=Vaccinium darrowii TaxID=229202 RepID=A0ACB7XIK7_9ERIC|nr:hypothetical protein Vadar_019279 [Vaccinium darrowii]
MIGGYVQNNCTVEAINLFFEALELERPVLDEVTFLSALTAASQFQRLDFAQQLHAYLMKDSAASHIMDNDGLMHVHEMQQERFTIDSITVTALLSAASNLRNLVVLRRTSNI